MKIILLNDTVDLENWGAQAGAEALKEILHNCFPDSILDSFTYNWIAKKYYISNKYFGNKINDSKNPLIQKFSKEFRFLPLVADEYEYVAKLWLNGKGGPQPEQFINSINNADFIIFNAEGSTYRNNATAIKALFLLWFAKTKFNIPTFFVNGSISLTYVDSILPAMIHKTFASLNAVSVREPYSYRNLKDFYPEIPASILPDTVFSFTENDLCKISTSYNSFRNSIGNSPYVCISLPILLTKIPDYYRQPPEYSPVIRLISRVKEVVPNVILLSKEPNESFVEKIAYDTGSFYFGPQFSYFDLSALLREAQFLISGRYHHLILASIGGCPSIPLTSSSHKIHGLCELMDGAIGFLPIDSTDIISNETSILKKSEFICNNRSSYKENLLKVTEKLRNRTGELGKLIMNNL